MVDRDTAVLVTGATGFLGSAIVDALVACGHTARCLVRGSSAAERTAKLRAALGARPDAIWSRIEVVAGDLAVPHLGLSAAEFAALGRRVGRIIHCGARVNMAVPYSALYETNVRATEDLLSLAASTGAAFSYVSSIAAVAAGEIGEPFELTAPVTGGYAQSKWSADRLVCVAHQEGRVRATILRPGRVTAEPRTGRSNPDDLLEQVVRTCVRLGTAPELATRVRLSPVDWVSRLVVALTAAGQAFHLVATETLPWSAVVTALRRAGYPVAGMPYEDWRERVTEAAATDRGLARLASALGPGGVRFDDRPALGAATAAEHLGAAFPTLPPAEALLDRTIIAWQRTGELPTLAGNR